MVVKITPTGSSNWKTALFLKHDPDLIEIPAEFLDLPTNLIEHVFGHHSLLLDPGTANQMASNSVSQKERLSQNKQHDHQTAF
jgi:hypothetical protein